LIKLSGQSKPLVKEVHNKLTMKASRKEIRNGK